jgi:molybdopterin-guanine dinucleotide biosynthesis protein B
LRDEPEWDLRDLVAKMSAVDLVLVEGFKRDPFPKIEVHRAANGKPLIHPDDSYIVAIAADTDLPQAKVPVVDLDNVAAIAELVLAQAVPLEQAEAVRSR